METAWLQVRMLDVEDEVSGLHGLVPESPACSRGAVSDIAQGERYSASPGSAVFFSLYNRSLVPRAECQAVAHLRRPTTHAVPLWASLDAVQAREFGFGLWRLRTVMKKKEDRNPGLAEYRSPWAIVDAAPRLIPGAPNARSWRTINLSSTPKSHTNRATVSKKSRYSRLKKDKSLRPLGIFDFAIWNLFRISDFGFRIFALQTAAMRKERP